VTPVFDNSCGLLLHSHGVSPIQNESRRVSFTAFRLVLPPRAHALIRLRQERDADRNERLIDSLDIGAAWSGAKHKPIARFSSHSSRNY
jgi:hypothetical protein